MTYEILIESISNIIDNEQISKDGLILTYVLTEKKHKQMNEVLFYKANPPTAVCPYYDEFEVEIEGLLVKFIKKVPESFAE